MYTAHLLSKQDTFWLSGRDEGTPPRALHSNEHRFNVDSIVGQRRGLRDKVEPAIFQLLTFAGIISLIERGTDPLLTES